MIILGFDPGIAILGYALIKKDIYNLKPLDYGVVKTSKNMCTPDRLVNLFNCIEDLVKKCKPDAIAVEEIFFHKNAKTVIAISQARGVIILASAMQNIPVYEYTPLQVKQSITGYGRAQKQQIQQMVKLLLNLNELPKPDDAADALAIAICHAHSYALNDKLALK